MTSFETVLYRCEGLLMPPPVLKTKNQKTSQSPFCTSAKSFRIMNSNIYIYIFKWLTCKKVESYASLTYRNEAFLQHSVT